MEPSAEQSVNQTKKSSNKIIIAVVVLLIVAIVAAAAVIIVLNQKEDSQKIGYAAEAKVMLDQQSLQAAMDEAMRNSKDKNIGLKYRNDAYSEDGVNFECYIVNSESNAHDMFLTIYADETLQDELFLSELVPPGSGFENIKLNHALEPGVHTVYVALTQVKTDENGEQIIHNQVMHTMDFHVAQP